MELIRPASEFNPECPEIGFYDLPEDVYRAAPGCNWSNIKRIGKTPKTYRWFADNADKDTDDKKFGRLFHTITLEPSLLGEQWVVPDETFMYKDSRKPKDSPPVETAWSFKFGYCQKWKRDTEAKGLQVVTRQQIRHAGEMRKELWALPDARLILADADGYEISAFWIDEETGLPCKCKLDILKNGQIGDLKKVASGHSPTLAWEKWCGHIRGWGYHGQAAFYRGGVDAVYKHMGLELPEIPMFKWLVVEDAKPYDTAIYSIYDTPEAASYQFFIWGRDLCKFLLREVAMWSKHDSWPSYNIGPSGMTEDHELEVPDWLNLEIR